MDKEQQIDQLDLFTQGYIDCAIWSTVPYAIDDETIPLEERLHPVDHSIEAWGYGIYDLSDFLLKEVSEDCQDFQQANKMLLEEYYKKFDPIYAGHDFWLTRNGHGAGFWDRGLGALGQKLTEACKPYGSCDWYINKDGQIDR